MSVVVAEKNHEQYLEQIEIAVAETTKELMSKHNGDLRAMAKVCAEKQVEINRLKEFQYNDRKTIKQLRAHLREAVDEISSTQDLLSELNEKYNKAVDELECRNSTWETKEKEYEAEIEELKERVDEAWSEYNTEHEMRDTAEKEVEELKSEIELQKDYIDAIPDKVEEYKDELHAVMSENRMLKKKISGEEIEKVFGVSEEVFEKLMKECPPDPDDYK